MEFTHQTVFSSNQLSESSQFRPRRPIYMKTKGTNEGGKTTMMIFRGVKELPENHSSNNQVVPVKKLLSIIQKTPMTVKKVEKYHKKYYMSTEQAENMIKFKTRRKSVSPNMRHNYLEEIMNRSKRSPYKPCQIVRQTFNRRKLSVYDFGKEINGASIKHRTKVLYL